MKKYGHTKTLFLQNGKYYKWSYKYEYCIECLTCNFKHKGNGLCTSCYDKKRAKKPNRVEIRKKAVQTFFIKHKKIPFKKERRVTRDKVKEIIFVSVKREIYKKSANNYYNRNKEALRILRKVKKLKNQGVQLLQANINGELRYLPFSSMEKPNCTQNNLALYDEWKQKKKEFIIIKNYYEKK